MRVGLGLSRCIGNKKKEHAESSYFDVLAREKNKP
jgi:hypothetical protein